MTEEKLRERALALAEKLRQPFSGDSWDVTILAFARDLSAEVRRETIDKACATVCHACSNQPDRHGHTPACEWIRAAFAETERGE